jgi:predicted RNA-binding Zn ribbon-like protein
MPGIFSASQPLPNLYISISRLDTKERLPNLSISIKRLDMIIEEHAFRSGDLVAGNIALDFINTVTGRDVAPRDWLDSYLRLVEWARFCAEFKAKDLDALSPTAKQDLASAKAALARATEFREVLCRSVYGMLGEASSDSADRLKIEQTYQSAMKAVRFEWGPAGCRLTWTAEASGLDLILHVVAVHAVYLLAHLDTGRLRICAGKNCGWVFLDTSRNGRRRWCDMATCGNVAKARRHYSRKRP